MVESRFNGGDGLKLSSYVLVRESERKSAEIGSLMGMLTSARTQLDTVQRQIGRANNKLIEQK